MTEADADDADQGSWYIFRWLSKARCLVEFSQGAQFFPLVKRWKRGTLHRLHSSVTAVSLVTCVYYVYCVYDYVSLLDVQSRADAAHQLWDGFVSKRKFRKAFRDSSVSVCGSPGKNCSPQSSASSWARSMSTKGTKLLRCSQFNCSIITQIVCPKRYTSIPWNPTVYHHFIHQSGSLYLSDKFGEMQKDSKRLQILFRFYQFFHKFQEALTLLSLSLSVFPDFSNSLRAALLRGSAVLSAGFPPPAATQQKTQWEASQKSAKSYSLPTLAIVHVCSRMFTWLFDTCWISLTLLYVTYEYLTMSLCLSFCIYVYCLKK